MLWFKSRGEVAESKELEPRLGYIQSSSQLELQTPSIIWPYQGRNGEIETSHFAYWDMNDAVAVLVRRDSNAKILQSVPGLNAVLVPRMIRVTH